MSTVIQTRELQKTFGRVRALDGLDLTVAAGEVHGFLGPNGAGKSTTIRILLGLMRGSGGSATVFGRDPWADASALHRRMAYVPGDVTLWPNLSGGEAIDLLGRLRGGTGTPAERARRAHLLDAFNLDPGKKGRTYSKGNRQKVALIAALATPADLYVLDEPTSGLDPLMEEVFRREIQAAAAAGAAVLLSSHILSEVEHLCDRVTIIRAGRTVQTGTLADLRHLTRTAVAFSAAGLTQPDLGQLAAGIRTIHDLVIEGGRVRFTADSDTLPDLLPLLARLRVQALSIAPPSLEELFLRHYRDDADGQARTEAEARP
ncbi:ABC transporter ATP-binding protein [Cryobacterium frigoriphilum]|uniref:ABC transporter ATP-binding protein n=1 Tax=Cryobacterium frigoriphilum TaxID=1259150 RepID=A0A4R8ZU76_9MICO|nr:ABC transporter ATP-binding protein [Cryobacterium frigoriphilum]TFD45987.1 ABC transporter ATP-binding protein [Cryobacterium frigoriphilum]